MKKSIAKRCLYIALSSAMILGGTATVFAAENAETDKVSVAGTEAGGGTAELSASDAYLWYSSMYESNGDVYISASGSAYKAQLWVNGVMCSEQINDSDYGSFNFDETIDGIMGATYKAQVIMYNSEGTKTVKSIGDVKLTQATVTGISTYQSSTTTDVGINKVVSVEVSAEMNNWYSGNIKYQVFRADKAGGKYTKIATASADDTRHLRYTDTSVKAGKTYYYKVRIVSGTDKYVKTNKVISTSGAASVKVGMPTASISTYPSGSSGGSKAGITLSIYSEFANRYDIYKSAYKTKGYKFLKTVYSNTYTDTNVKKGKVYYYKVVPKYYSSGSGKTITGETSSPAGVRYIMDCAYPTLTQVSNTSMKCQWGGDNTPDVSYEVWVKRNDLVGDAYKKVAATKKNECIIKKLAANGTYEVKIRTVKKAGAVVKYEESNSNYRTMGYTDTVQDFYINPLKSDVNSAKTVMKVKYMLTWYRDWGASGYIITATNNYTGKTETIKKITSGKPTSCTVTNTGTSKNGVKYSNIRIKPYKGKAVGNESYSGDEGTPSVKKVKAARKTGTSVKIAWTPVKGATRYTIYRFTELGVSQRIGETSKTTFVDTHVTNGLKYSYSVQVTKTVGGFSGSYSTLSAEYVHKLGTPKITGIANSSAGTATLKWGKVPNARKYYVYRSDKKNGTYKLAGKTSAATLTFANKKLAKGKTYYYKVVAYTVNAGGKTVRSAASPAKGVKIVK